MKKVRSKTNAKAAPVKMESSSHLVEGNIWFNLGLSKNEAALLKFIAGNFFEGKASSGYAARVLLQGAMAHFDVLNPLIMQDASYTHDEGFLSMDTYLQDVIVHQHARIASLKGSAK